MLPKTLLGVLPVCAGLLLAGCRKGEAQAGSQFVPITPSIAGNQGCNGPARALGAPVAVFSDPSLGRASQVVAVAGAEVLFYTGADGGIHRLEFPGPTHTVLVAPGVVDALLGLAGIPGTAELAGLGVIDVADLVVVEQTSNTLLLVNRLVPDTVAFLAGLPSEVPGFADGFGGQIRFSLAGPSQVLSTGTGLAYVADAGNHSVRVLTVGPLPACETVSGSGSPAFDEGRLEDTRFDTPSGLSVSCGGELLVTESGTSPAGNRLRSLAIGTRSFFGGFDGTSLTLAGDGQDASVAGVDDLSSLAGPVSPVSSSDGLVFWVDSHTGVLRRYDFATGLADCPLSGCATADFTGRGGFSLALTSAGTLYVLDGEAGTLYQVTP